MKANLSVYSQYDIRKLWKSLKIYEPRDRIVVWKTPVVNEKGVALTAFALRSRFDNARDAAALKATDPKLLARIRDFQFRDLRAKAGTDKEDSGGMGEAKDLLGHADEKMTKRYVRHRIGKRVSPTR